LETAADFRDPRGRNSTAEWLCAASLPRREDSGDTSLLHPSDVDDDLPALAPLAHHGKTTIDAKSPDAVPEDIESK
jgi:hypothetical protein